eukprot:TRINITY_DN31675_c0_g1_i1.p3 TRINITY_DN31675_c0_g1~~TRINITY_DN31675_c0_g1_i1.p3  ORF type:complete len:147 (-),score=3.70 TRINITY_DN31675_c0_g1_i1:1249-1689(-)
MRLICCRTRKRGAEIYVQLLTTVFSTFQQYGDRFLQSGLCTSSCIAGDLLNVLFVTRRSNLSTRQKIHKGIPQSSFANTPILIGITADCYYACKSQSNNLEISQDSWLSVMSISAGGGNVTHKLNQINRGLKNSTVLKETVWPSEN